MSNTPTWAELHAMEPGLRPDDFMHEESSWARRINDALSRDRACEWLAEHRSGWTVENWSGHGWDCFKMAGEGNRAQRHYGKQLGTFPTRDEALRAACAAIIAQRQP